MPGLSSWTSFSRSPPWRGRAARAKAKMAEMPGIDPRRRPARPLLRARVIDPVRPQRKDRHCILGSNPPLQVNPSSMRDRTEG